MAQVRNCSSFDAVICPGETLLEVVKPPEGFEVMRRDFDPITGEMLTVIRESSGKLIEVKYKDVNEEVLSRIG